MRKVRKNKERNKKLEAPGIFFIDVFFLSINNTSSRPTICAAVVTGIS
jgi:hypothetical protein